jgi:hypothetical protein
LVSHPKASTGYVPIVVKDNDIVQQTPRNLKMGNVELVHQLQANIKQEALSWHFFFEFLGFLNVLQDSFSLRTIC